MEVALILAAALLISAAVAYFISVSNNHAITEVEQWVQDRFDILEEEISALDDQFTASRQQPVPGIYNEHGQLVFGDVHSTGYEDSPLHSEELGYFETPEALDRAITHDLDGTVGNEPQGTAT